MAKLLFDANGVFIRRVTEKDDSVDAQIYGLKASQIVLDDPLKEGKEDA